MAATVTPAPNALQETTSPPAISRGLDQNAFIAALKESGISEALLATWPTHITAKVFVDAR